MKKRILCAVASLLLGTAALPAFCPAFSLTSFAADSEAAYEADSEADSGMAAETMYAVGSLKGPTSIGLVSMMEEYAKDYTFTMETAADVLSASFLKGDLDIALIPANMAAILYNKTEGGVQVIDVNTLGVLYLVTARDDVASVADLAGGTVYMTGKGQTPEYVLNYLLEANGLTEEDVTVEYRSEAAEVVSLLAQDESAVGVLPQPFASVACRKNEKLKTMADLTEEWNKTQNGTLVTGVTVVKKELAQGAPEAVEAFLAAHESSASFVAEEPEQAAELTVAAGIIEDAEAARDAVPKCNVTCLKGEKMQEALAGYLGVLFAQNPESVGGALPGDDFYYLSADIPE